MFIFSVWESVFLVSMAFGFFYSWQTYCEMDNEIEPTTLMEVFQQTKEGLGKIYRALCFSKSLGEFMSILTPPLDALEKFTGRGGNLRSGYGTDKKNDDDNVQLA